MLSSNSGAFLIWSFVRLTKTFSSLSSTRMITPAGSMTFLPKIHGPVSTTRYDEPTSLLASSILPIPPSTASTPYPVRLVVVHVCSRYVQMSMVAICITPFVLGVTYSATRKTERNASQCEGSAAADRRDHVDAR